MGYVSGYVTANLPEIAINGFTVFLLTILTVVKVIVVVALYKWGKSRVK